MPALSGYTYWKVITEAYQTVISANQTNITLAVRIDSTHTNFWAHQDGQGGYVRFTLTDGTTLLNFEVERYDTANKIAVWHVQVPTLSASVATQYQVNYGTGSPTDGSSASATWDSNFAAVYHLNANAPSGAFADSTSNGNNGTNLGTTDVAGQIDRGRLFTASSSQYIFLANFNFSTGLTGECWVKPSTITGQMLVGEEPSSEVQFVIQGNGVPRIRVDTVNGNPRISDGTTAVTTSAFFHLAYTYDASTSTLDVYVNGVKETVLVNTTGSGNIIDRNIVTRLGARSDGFYYNGIMDEVTMSDVARSADWIAARYHSGLGDLQTIGAEQTASGFVLLSGTATGLSALTGSETVNYSASGTIAGQSSLTGGMSANLALAGTTAGLSVLSGTTGLMRSINGTTSGQSGLSGIPVVDYGLSGTVAGQSALTGTLSVSGSGIILLQGTAAGQSNLSAGASVDYSIAGTVAGQSSITGTGALTLSLTGSMAGISSLSGTAALVGKGALFGIDGFPQGKTVEYKLVKKDGTVTRNWTSTNVVEVQGPTLSAYYVIDELANETWQGTVYFRTTDLATEKSYIYNGTPDNAGITAIKAKTDTINWPDITDLHDEALGKWVLDPAGNTLTLYKADGVTVLKTFNLGSTTATVPNYISRTPA